MNAKQAAHRARRKWRLALLAAALALAACSAQVDLHTGLTDVEANQVVAALRNDGVMAVKRITKTGVNVSVPEADLARASAVLVARGLPHRPAERMGDVFKKEGLISSPLEERARYVFALSQELESTIAQIDGVVVARVHVVLPEKVAPGEPVQPPSAAVFIKHLPSLEPDAVGFRVRQLVARSIPGLGSQSLDRVSVVFVLADPLPARPLAPADRTPLLWGLLALTLTGAAAALALQVRQRGWLRRRKPDTAAPASTATPA